MPSGPPRPQPKLEVGAPDDRWEREADRVAERVVTLPEPRAELADGERGRPAPGHDSGIRRTGGGSGAALPAPTRQFMEPRFGHDFSGVRIHSGSAATGLCRALDARAFTLGRDVFFSGAQFRPGTHEGRRLLAHELTHVVQQGRAPRVEPPRPAGAASAVGQGLTPRIQRRTARPIRSDKTRTFTYPLKVYTIDDESFAEADAVAAKLNSFSGKVTVGSPPTEYTVRFAVEVLAPPAPEVLEQAFGIRLHFRLGRKRVRKRKYRDAAQRWWVQKLKSEGNTDNLYLGENKPTEDTKDYLRETAQAAEKQQRRELLLEYRRQNREAKELSGSTSDEPDPAAADTYRKSLKDLNDNSPTAALEGRLDDPFALEGSRGTTFAESVVQMRPSRGAPGSAAYQQNIRLHEFMHLLGLDMDYDTLQQSIMSYPNLTKHKGDQTVLGPEPDDIEALFYANPPSETSVD